MVLPQLDALAFRIESILIAMSLTLVIITCWHGRCANAKAGITRRQRLGGHPDIMERGIRLVSLPASTIRLIGNQYGPELAACMRQTSQLTPQVRGRARKVRHLGYRVQSEDANHPTCIKPD